MSDRNWRVKGPLALPCKTLNRQRHASIVKRSNLQAQRTLVMPCVPATSPEYLLPDSLDAHKPSDLQGRRLGYTVPGDFNKTREGNSIIQTKNKTSCTCWQCCIVLK